MTVQIETVTIELRAEVEPEWLWFEPGLWMNEMMVKNDYPG